MEKLKFYVKDENTLNNYEKEHKKISYKTLIEYLFNDMILCNDFYKADDEFTNYIESGEKLFYDEEEDYYCDIYQYFIVNFPNFMLDFIKKYCQDEIILFYSYKLDLYVLGVDHYGTGWDYVLTNFEYTTDYENSMQGKLYEN